MGSFVEKIDKKSIRPCRPVKNLWIGELHSQTGRWSVVSQGVIAMNGNKPNEIEVMSCFKNIAINQVINLPITQS